MKKIVAILIIIITHSSPLLSQVSFKNAQCFGGQENEYGTAMGHTNDGGYILAGSTLSTDGNVSGNHGGGDCWIVRLNQDIQIEWQKCFGGSVNDEATSIQQTFDGGYIFAGITQSNDGDVTGYQGGRDIWVVKLE